MDKILQFPPTALPVHLAWSFGEALAGVCFTNTVYDQQIMDEIVQRVREGNYIVPSVLRG